MYPWWERWSHHSQKFLFLFLWELYFAFGKWILYHLPSFNRKKDNKNHDKKIIYPEMLKKKKIHFWNISRFLDIMCLSDEGRKINVFEHYELIDRLGSFNWVKKTVGWDEKSKKIEIISLFFGIRCCLYFWRSNWEKDREEIFWYR